MGQQETGFGSRKSGEGEAVRLPASEAFARQRGEAPSSLGGEPGR